MISANARAYQNAVFDLICVTRRREGAKFIKARVLSGVDRIHVADDVLLGKRVGLMTAPSGVNRELISTIDIVNERYNLSALFAPEHGIRGDRQASEKIAEREIDTCTGAVIFSVYGKNHRFSDEMLDAFDVLVYDIQDVGARFYTYLYSLGYAMQACARAGKRLVVLDRINPLGGTKLCGTVIDQRYSSFIGNYSLPTRYALTVGEYALYIKDYLAIDVDLNVVRLEGWSRDMYLDDTDINWVAPSPNCPNLSSALCYIGNCAFEGTNVSEGRGTTLPFELIGADWIDGAALERRMRRRGLAGVIFRRASFTPSFSKYAGRLCHGVQTHVVDRSAYNPFEDGLALMDEIRQMYADKFEFIRWPGETAYPIDLLLGTNEYREGGLTAGELVASHAPKVKAFEEATKKYRLY